MEPTIPPINWNFNENKSFFIMSKNRNNIFNIKFKNEKLTLGFIPAKKCEKKSNLVKRAFQPNNDATPYKINMI